MCIVVHHLQSFISYTCLTLRSNSNSNAASCPFRFKITGQLTQVWFCTFRCDQWGSFSGSTCHQCVASFIDAACCFCCIRDNFGVACICRATDGPPLISRGGQTDSRASPDRFIQGLAGLRSGMGSELGPHDGGGLYTCVCVCVCGGTQIFRNSSECRDTWKYLNYQHLSHHGCREDYPRSDATVQLTPYGGWFKKE